MKDFEGKVRDILRKNHWLVLSTANKNGIAQGSVVVYASDGNTIYILTGKETLKTRNIGSVSARKKTVLSISAQDDCRGIEGEIRNKLESIVSTMIPNSKLNIFIPASRTIPWDAPRR